MAEMPSQIQDLIDRFGTQSELYNSPTYNETNLRIDFVNPMFKVLGWDIDNTKGYAEAFREVVHEDAIRITGTIKSPDYSLRIGGRRIFFLEAKKPAVNIYTDVDAAYQLRRYAWTAGLPLSILTNFKEFAVYDCRFEPKYLQKASTARLWYFTFNEYAQRWDEIASIFSPEGIQHGAFDRYVQSKKKSGTQKFDDVFLDEMEEWRKRLAGNLALRNDGLDDSGLNFATQLIIDRIVFLRMCEDRGVEPPFQLQALLSGDNTYARLRQLFNKADQRYNSGLFHFRKEKDRHELPDELTLDLDVDDATLKYIIKRLYYPDSPYVFKEVAAEILGSVYERFLGNVIYLTAGHRAKIEPKPEVRKAHGVYYTPSYVVNYIVKNTVGALINGMTPTDAAKLRILDPACGSGSFLLGAYQYLLDWHQQWYLTNEPHKWSKGGNPALRPGPRGHMVLSIRERKRILTANIYGVDIDPQAVEVTKLSLLLKCLEGESAQSIDDLLLFHERALPDLGDNVKCGNSLISTDIYQTRLWQGFNHDEQTQLRPFDWQQAFQNSDTFDAVIGNPPYRRELDYKHLMDQIAVGSLGLKYRSPRMDLWYYFVHRGLELLKPHGVLSFIVNAYWTAGTGAQKLIAALRDEAHVDELFAFGKLKVFEKVSGQHMIIRLSRMPSPAPTLINAAQPKSETTAEPFIEGNAKVLSFNKTSAQLFHDDKVDLQPPADTLLAKIGQYPQLDSFGIIRQGIAENPSQINRKTNTNYGGRWNVGEGVFSLVPKEVQRLKLSRDERALLRDYHDLCDLGRYALATTPSRLLIYSTRYTCNDINRFPRIGAHLRRFKPILDKRRETREGSNQWWHLHWPRDESIWRSPKVISIQMGLRPAFVCANEPVYVPFSVNVFVPGTETKESISYFTGILNSRLLWKWFMHNAKRRGAGLEINGNVLQRAPIRPIDFSNKKDKSAHDRLVAFVDQMLSMHKSLVSAQSPVDKESLQRQIDSTDHQIDRLVYEIYDLSDDEIKIVDQASWC